MIIYAAIIGLLLGLYAGILITTMVFSSALVSLSNIVSLQIDPLQIISLIVSIAMALFILRKLGKLDEKSKATRDLIIRYLDDAVGNIEVKVCGLSHAGEYDVTEVNNWAKLYRSRIASYVELAIRHNFLSAATAPAVLAKEHAKELWVLLTLTNPTDSNVTAQNGKYQYSTNQLNVIQSHMLVIKNSHIDLVDAINLGWCRK